MKKLLSIFLFSMAIKLNSVPFSFIKHENVWLESKNDYFPLIQKGNFYDENLKKYMVDETLFVCVIDSMYHTVYGYDIKKEIIISNFMFEVFSKKTDLKYNIRKVVLTTDDIEKNLFDAIYRYYPFDGIRKTDFRKSFQNSDFYSSKTFTGFFKIPCKKNAELKIKVILDVVFENETKTLEFEYLYTVKKSAGFIRLND